MHLTHLETVFQKLQEHGLKLQHKKCSIFKKGSYLGHLVNQKEVAPDPDKVKAVKD